MTPRPGRRGHAPRPLRSLLTIVGVVAALHACGAKGASSTARSSAADAGADADGGLAVECAHDPRLAGQKIQHVIVIMQENRSFDHYFGTFPGAEGIPVDASGVPTVCVPDPMTGVCQLPYHDTSDENFGGPHTSADFLADYDDGKLDGFVANAEADSLAGEECINETTTECVGQAIDVMGYHTGAEIPNYWAYAKAFALNDNLFAPVASWSFPNHLAMVSAWSAACTADDPLACKTELEAPGTNGLANTANRYPWTDLTYLLHAAGVCWRYYLSQGTDPHCGNVNGGCQPIPLDPGVTSIWNPLPGFDDVVADKQTDHVEPLDKFYEAVASDSLPAVSWIVPSSTVSEHPAARVSAGQAYVTAIINTIMQSASWQSSVIFLSWDDWGGFYDHVKPKQIDAEGLGFRVPGLVISPWVKQAGLIDKQLLSHDSYTKFIEDTFLHGARLDPTTDGRPDSRPFVRDAYTQLGDLRNDLDLSRDPLPPLVLPLFPVGPPAP